MSTYTENYGLTMPEENDYYDVEIYNENLDTLDKELASTTAEVETVSDKIGSPNDIGTDTVFGKLNNGSSLVKSMQTIDTVIASSATDSPIPVVTPLDFSVEPSKCLVIMTRLTNSASGILSYTLNESDITATVAFNGSTITYR